MRRAALRSAPLDQTLENLFIKDGVMSEKDPRTLVELLLVFSRVASSETIAAALLSLEIPQSDIGLTDARRVAVRAHAPAVLRLAARTKEKDRAQTSAPKNLLPDPSLTTIEGWEPYIYGGDRDTVTHLHSKDQGRNGSACLVISATSPIDTGWGFPIKVKPNTRYEFGGYIRTKNLKVQRGPGVLFNIHRGTRTKSINTSQGWTKLSTTFTTSADQREELFHGLLGAYGRATGTVYFDDFFFHELGESSPLETPEELAKWFAGSASNAQLSVLKSSLEKIQTATAQSLLNVFAETPRKTELTRKFPIDQAVHERGAAVYAQTCIACHGPGGKGVDGVFPPLLNSDWITKDQKLPAKIVLHGLTGPIIVNGKKYSNVMPPLGRTLNDQQIADVLTFVRQSWSNDSSPVTAQEIQKVRKDTSDRKEMYQPQELHR